jgi:predicted PurR-regulated permease PerM
MLVVSVVAALYLARAVLIPIALAGLLTFLLAPAVRRLERWRVPRGVAVIAVVGLVGVAVGTVGWVLESQAAELASTLPAYRANIREKLERLRPAGSGPWARAGEVIAEIGNDIAKATDVVPDVPAGTAPPREVVAVKLAEPEPTPLAYAKSLLGPLFGPLVLAGIVAVFTIFMLMKREDMRDRFIRLVGARSLQLTTQALDDAAHGVNRYLVMQLASNVVAGTAVGVGLYGLGLPSPGLWAALVVMMRFIPFAGMWIAAALPLAVSVAQSPDWTAPLMAFGLFAVVEIVAANFVEPVLLGTGTGLSAIAVLASAVFWGWLWGGVGLVLATPLTVCVAVIGRHVPHLEFFDVLLGKESGLSLEARLYQRLLAGDVDEATHVVSEYAKERPAAEVYDGLVLPALRMAEADRHRGDLDEGREKFIVQAVKGIVETLAGTHPGEPGPEDEHGAPALCVPAWDDADGLAAEMLAHVLRGVGVAAEDLSSESLTGELIATVSERRPAVVCLSSVPPGAMMPARVLYRRLKAKIPGVHVVVALWDPGMNTTAAAEALGLDGADRVVTSMIEAGAVVKALAGTAPLDDEVVVRTAPQKLVRP